MGTRASDLDQAVRAAAGIDNADIPHLSPAAIAELVAETVETIAWTYADAPGAISASASASASASTTHRRRRIVLAQALAIAVVAGTALTVSGVLTMKSHTNATVGLADWQAVPVRAPDALARAEATACIRELEPDGSKYPSAHFTLNDSLLAEQRGRTEFTMLANADGFGICLFLDGRGDGGTGSYDPGYPHPAATGISLAVNGSSWTMDINNKRVDTFMAAGFAGSEVAGITIQRADGVVVTASISDGLWAAWWPNATKSVSVTVYTRDGHTQTTPIGKVTTVRGPMGE